MAFKVADRVKETSTSTGTGSFTLAGAASAAYRTFASVLANNDTTFYCIAHQSAAEWEFGLGTWTTGGILVRTDAGVLSGSGGASARVSFSAGTKDVFITVGCDRLPILDDEDGLQLPGTVGNVLPRVPPAGYLKLFVRNKAGRIMLNTIGPAGIDTQLQPALFGNNVVLWMPSSAALAANTNGTLWTLRNSGTNAAKSHPAPASTNAYTAMKRAEFSTGTTATGSSGEQSDLQFYRGAAAGRGGFFFTARFGVGAFSGTWQLLIGLSALNAALAGEPSAQNNTCGLIKDSTDTNYQIFTRNSIANKTDSGLAPTAAQILDFSMFMAPNGADVTMRLVDPMTGTVYVDNVLKNLNVPFTDTFMAMHAQIRSASGTTAKVLGVNRMYCESDV